MGYSWMSDKHANGRGWKKPLLLALTLALAGGKSFAVDALSGGNVNLINTLYSTSNLSLDLTANGTNATLATFIINNNAANSFTFAVTMVNGGEFIKAGQADGSGVKLTGCNYNPGSTGTLGAGLTALLPPARATVLRI